MSLLDRTPPSQSGFIALEVELRHAPEQVWRALTDPVLLAAWLLPVADLKLEPAADFEFRAEPQPGWDGTVQCRVLEVDARRRLSYAWVVGDIDTVVTFTLTPTGSGTRLSLVQSGFRADQKRNFAGARYGWKKMSERLLDLLARTR